MPRTIHVPNVSAHVTDLDDGQAWLIHAHNKFRAVARKSNGEWLAWTSLDAMRDPKRAPWWGHEKLNVVMALVARTFEHEEAA